MNDIYTSSNTEIIRSLGRHFKAYRIQCRLTQRELAEQTGISVPTIRGFENGKSVNVSLQVLLSLMRAIGQLEQIEQVLPELPQNPKEVFEMKAAPKRVTWEIRKMNKNAFLSYHTTL